MPTPSKKAKKCQTMAYMPNAIFSCQTTFKKTKYLEFGLKNANLATLRTSSRDEHGPGLDRTGSGLKLILAGSGLDRTAIFLKIGGSRSD